MSSKQPDNLGEVLRLLQDSITPQQHANQLFTKYVLPIVQRVKNRLLARYQGNPRMREWLESECESFVYELLVIRPRQMNKSIYNSSQYSTFEAWLMKCLHNEAASYCRKNKLAIMDPDRLEPRKTLAPYRPDGPEADDQNALIEETKRLLLTGLQKVSRLAVFSRPQRANEVDYFSVLLLIVWLRLAQLFYDELRTGHSGQELVCELAEFLKQWLPIPDDWHSRRITVWSPTVREILDALLHHCSQTNERPKMKHITSILSHFLNQSHINCEDAIRCQWAQWVKRTRYRYSTHADLLTHKEKQLLGSLTQSDDENEQG